MTMIESATPYLMLNGQGKRALALYAETLGARVETLQHFGDIDDSCDEAQRGMIMHAALRIGDALLMMSDGPKEATRAQASPVPVTVSVALDFSEREELRRCFDALAKTGATVVPVTDAPWGLFGALQDELGVHWMFNCGNDSQVAKD